MVQILESLMYPYMQDGVLELVPIELTAEMRLVLVHAEMYHLQQGASTGCIPMELVCSSISKSATPKRLQELDRLKERLHSSLPVDSPLLDADEGIDEDGDDFQLLVVAVSVEQVPFTMLAASSSRCCNGTEACVADRHVLA